ncbi:MAG: hypothetical protein ABIQ17_05465 [Candidatus Limnocylindrales bacterium]
MDQGPAGHAAATVQSVARLEQSIRDRSSTDRKFINWWVYWLLLSWITLGIAGLVYFYRRMSRIDAFSRRKAAYYDALVEYTERRAERAGSAAAIRPMTDQLRADLQAAGRSSLKPINAGLHLLLTFITLGLWAIVVYYMVNRAWDDRQRFEAEFDDRLSQAWLQLGLLRHPIAFRIDEGKHRNFALWLILSILTLGIGFIVWDYRLHSDPDRLYPEFHTVEDSFLQIARTA